jgi:hypothetical protein
VDFEFCQIAGHASTTAVPTSINLRQEEETMSMDRREAMKLIAGAIPVVASTRSFAGMIPVETSLDPSGAVKKFVFENVESEIQIPIKELGLDSPADLAGYSHLVMEMRMSSPQRLILWLYTTNGPRSMSIIGFGQNVWLRASIPLKYFVAQDSTGDDLAATTNRRMHSCWLSVTGPFGDLHSVEAIAIAMEYPLNKPTIELRNVHLSKNDEGSEFLESGSMLDSFGQWARANWPRKLKSREQLTIERATEESTFGSLADFGYGHFGGYKNTQALANGFFRVQRIDGRWWFVDPQGHLFLSTGINDTPGGGAGFENDDPPTSRTNRRLDSWGMTTGGLGRPRTVFLHWPVSKSFLGMPDVYSAEFAEGIDAAANRQCTPLRNDPMVIGYFVGNEPPWNGRESELCGLILGGPDTVTKAKLKDFLVQGDTPVRRRKFVLACFEAYLEVICRAVRKYDPNHLLLGIRFGGRMADEALIIARVFDVCSINVYEYEPTKQLIHAARLSGRPILIGEFHVGVPADGLAAGLVQAKDQAERGIAYRYYVEQAASLEWFVGAYWFKWRDEPVLGRQDGENYNLGFVDVTDRPYVTLVEAAKTTHKQLFDVHSGKVMPFAQRPMASEVGAPSTPWSIY